MKRSHLILFILLAIALFLRTARASVLTGFYFDQGRDAKVIWDLWHHGRFFMIGPTTGIEGIFLGPLYYYLIAPFYLIGGGNPVFAAVGLAGLCVISIWVFYLIGAEYFSRPAGIFAAILISFSLTMVQSHRWLSNPTPLYLSSALVVYLMLRIVHGSKSGWSWFWLGLLLGASLQFEAASAVFFLPAVLIIFVIYRRHVHWKVRHLLHLLFSFLLTLLPQLVFDFRHDHILIMAFRNFLITEKSFTPPGSGFISGRLGFYFVSFMNTLTLDRLPAGIIAACLLILAILSVRKLPPRPLGVLLIWLFTPLFFLLLYRGNNGYVWGYYFTGVYQVFLLLTGVVSAYYYTHSRLPFRKGLIGLFMAYFLVWNGYHLYHYLRANPDGPTAVMLGSSLAAVDWVYSDADNKPFNVDVYVPPVISHAYDYLFLWRGTTRYHHLPDEGRQPLLYTLYEVDPPHPERLELWLGRQATYAGIDTTVSFGGVSVDRRHRL